MPDTLEIKLAQASELPALRKLYAALVPEDPLPDVPDEARTFEQIEDRPGMHILIGWFHGEAVTTATTIIVPNLTRNCTPIAFI